MSVRAPGDSCIRCNSLIPYVHHDPAVANPNAYYDPVDHSGPYCSSGCAERARQGQ